MTLHTWRVAVDAAHDGHTYPTDDEIDHEPTPDCICGPTHEPARRHDGTRMTLHVHHSLSGYEEGL